MTGVESIRLCLHMNEFLTLVGTLRTLLGFKHSKWYPCAMVLSGITNSYPVTV